MKRISLLFLAIAVSACGTEAGPGTATITQLSANDAQDVSLSVSPDGSQVAFWRPGGNGYDLWVADADLKNARPLEISSRFGRAFPPVWSADGRRLAVPASNRSLADVAVVDVETDSVDFLTDSPALEAPFQFHPDGDHVVFGAYASGGTVRAFTASQSTGVITPLLPDLDDPAIAYVSPDGEHIAYFTFGGGGNTIWVSDAEGGARRQLTKDGYEGLPDRPDANVWSPDGRRILYISTRTGKPDIWVASLDGTTRQLTTDINSDHSPVWSPDGKKVAFISDRGRQTDIWVVPAQGGEAIRVTDDALEESLPTWVDDSTLVYASGRLSGTYWRRAVTDTVESRILPDSIVPGGLLESPDRQWIAFTIDHPDQNEDLALVRPDGSDLRIISRNASHGNMRWNPSSTKLAWASDQGGSWDVYFTDVESDAPPIQLQNWPGFDSPAYWSSDGRSLVIVSDRESRLGDLWRIPLGNGDTTRLSNHGSIIEGGAYYHDGRQHTLVAVIEQASGAMSLAEWLPGDSLRTIIAGNPTFPLLPINGLLAVLLTREGRTELQVLRPGGSVVQKLSAAAGRAFSADDSQLLYNTLTDGQLDLALLDVATGKTTQLTSTPEDEDGAMFTAGGDSIVLRRGWETSLLMRAELKQGVGSRE